MRTVVYISIPLAAVYLAPGCSDDPDGLTGSRPYSGDPGGAKDDDNDPPATAKDPGPTPPKDASFADRTLARARQWIDVKMPYSGGPNGGKDLICGGTCER